MEEETRKRKAAERKPQRLDKRLKYANANRFGDKRQKLYNLFDFGSDERVEMVATYHIHQYSGVASWKVRLVLSRELFHKNL